MDGDLAKYDTVVLSEDGRAVEIIDQTLLPQELKIVELRTAQEIWDAIYLLKVRGAPAIGVAAAYGIYVLSLAAAENADGDIGVFYESFDKERRFLNSARPTAVNLSWALTRMDQKVRMLRDAGKPLSEIIEGMKQEAVAIQEEDIAICKGIGTHGLTLIDEAIAKRRARGADGKVGLLTHCNAGRLATSRYGTATAPMYLAHEKGYDFKVFADETRPLLQGARLTATELSLAGIDVTLQCDNMASLAMKKGWIDAVFVGCDRVAANGDAANKIGTSGVAILAKHYGIPFYVCAPSSTIDPDTAEGSGIVIEERDGSEVTEKWYAQPMAPDGVSVFNPAFDVTDAELITAIVTEDGIYRYPYDFRNIRKGQE